MIAVSCPTCAADHEVSNDYYQFFLEAEGSDTTFFECLDCTLRRIDEAEI